MTLKKEFRQMVEIFVKDRIEILSKAVPESKKYYQIWKFEHEADFFYGHTIGNLEGYAMGIFLAEYNRKLTFDELNEVKEIIETHAKEIREKIYRKSKNS